MPDGLGNFLCDNRAFIEFELSETDSGLGLESNVNLNIGQILGCEASQ
jgi:hypothetical protein